MPIIPYEERVAIVQAIRFVDQAVPQVTMNKLDAWQTYQFDAMFHGDDWKGSALYNDIEKSLREVGCDLVFFASHGRHLLYDFSASAQQGSGKQGIRVHT